MMTAPAPSMPLLNAVLIEDDAQIRRFVRMALEDEHWQVFEATTVRQGLAACASSQPHLVIADLGLPDGDGVTLIRELRAWSSVPVLVLSARTGERQKVEALDAGADDYLTKPFSVAELMARVRAHVRRATKKDDSATAHYSFGDVEVDLGARSVVRAGAAVHLTPIEYGLLTTLITNAGRVVTQ